jgi:hypothetical protein
VGFRFRLLSYSSLSHSVSSSTSSNSDTDPRGYRPEACGELGFESRDEAPSWLMPAQARTRVAWSRGSRAGQGSVVSMHSGAALRWAWIGAAICCLVASASWAANSVSQHFNDFLVEGYSQLAVAGGGESDPRASYFLGRAALAAQGREVWPADPNKSALDYQTLREASFARHQLVHRLAIGARQRQPLLAAIAQVNFDCWIARLPKEVRRSESDECRRRFYLAFVGLAPPRATRTVRHPGAGRSEPHFGQMVHQLLASAGQSVPR